MVPQSSSAPDLEIRLQGHEDAFKQMKNPQFLGWSRMFHWTDSKVRVHAFYTVLACSPHPCWNANWRARGVTSINSILEELAGIGETLVI